MTPGQLQRTITLAQIVALLADRTPRDYREIGDALGKDRRAARTLVPLLCELVGDGVVEAEVVDRRGRRVYRLW